MTVVLTTDRSERSLRVAAHAAALARGTGRELVALHVMPRPATADVDPDRAWFEHENAQRSITRELEEALGRCDPLPRVVVGHTRKGETLHRAILRQASEEHAFALAMDSRGAGLVRRVALGSVAIELVQRSHLPVMVTGDAAAPPPEQASEPYTIVAGCDGSPASEDAIRVLGPLLHGSSARLVVARIDELARGEVIGPTRHETLEAELRRCSRHLPSDVAPEQVVEPLGSARSVADALVDLAQRLRASAISVSTRSHAQPRRLIAGGTSIALLERSPLPVFLTHGSL